ncbi:MAG TPA: RnfH family protein [Gammaproteobacteria bacterium]|uniref:RnfH family protein n=1 Tax=Immundisolibacter sp. TaxID=1934948 RepID=UPI000E8607A5|nr:RnfH family protein [Gammaproteobacteria bacterium]MCH79250.1 RnfH family protein [Gammaproteobacteria bacterium]
MQVEIAWPQADGGYQVRTLDLPPGTRAGQALQAAGLALPEGAALGVYGRTVEPEAPLAEGDRLEVFLPLRVDPKTARRRRAAAAEKNRR